MEPASLLLLLAFSAIVAILYTKGNAWLMSSSWGTKIYGNGSFFRATAVATIVIFAALIGASLILGAVDARPKLPSASI